MKNLELSVALPVYRGWEEAEQCLRSLEAAEKPGPMEIIVVDDASGDHGAKKIGQLFPAVKILVNEKNLGLSGSINRALKVARGKYFLRLDADTEVEAQALVQLWQFMENHPQVGVVGPRLIFPDGREQPSFFLHWPSPRIVARDFNFVLMRLKERFSSLRPSNLPQEPFPVAHLLGAALFLRKKAIASVGEMDPAIPFFRDETDWQYRFHQQGWEIWYHPQAVIKHRGGQSSGQKYYIFAHPRNWSSFWRFNRKHYPGAVSELQFRLAILSGSLLSWLGGILIYSGRFCPFLPPRYRQRCTEVGGRILRSFSRVIFWTIKGQD